MHSSNDLGKIGVAAIAVLTCVSMIALACGSTPPEAVNTAEIDAEAIDPETSTAVPASATPTVQPSAGSEVATPEPVSEDVEAPVLTGRGSRAEAGTTTEPERESLVDPTPTAAPAPSATPTAATPTPTIAPTVTPTPATPTATPTSTPTATPTSTPTALPAPSPTPTIEPAISALGGYFATIPAGEPLPPEAACAAAVRARPSPETHAQNAAPNSSPGGPSVRIDGADGYWNSVLAPRITGNFTGTTEELIRWAACKWGFDEDLTRARAWTESSWRVGTEGDQTNDAGECALIGLSAPCFQSYGLLQVKGTVHEGTFPHAHQSSAWGLDYAMAWQRACLEGSFEWLIDDGYVANDVRGCVGAWYSGEWYDSLAYGYLEDVDANLANAPWN